MNLKGRNLLSMADISDDEISGLTIEINHDNNLLENLNFMSILFVE